MKKTTGINVILLGGVVFLLGIGYYFFTRAVEEEVERPEVAIISPADGSVVSQEVGIIDINIRFSPPKAGKRERALKVALNDIDITSDIIVGGGYARGWVAARLGQNVLKAEVDGGESEAVSRFKVSIRPSLPEESASGGEEETKEDITIGEGEPEVGEGEPEVGKGEPEAGEGEPEEGEEEPLPEIVFHPGKDDETPPAFGGIIFQRAAKQQSVEPAGEQGEVIKTEEPVGDKAPSCQMHVTITYPADGSEVDKVELPVRGMTCPELSVRLYVSLYRHGREEILVTRANANGSYEFHRLHFREGDNSISVIVSDEAGNIARAESNFRVEVDGEGDEGDEGDESPCTSDIWIDCPEKQAFSVGEKFVCDINICFPDRNLMVYDMRIKHDPGVVNLVEASGGDAGEFSKVVINIKNAVTDGGSAVSPFNGVNNGSTLFASPSGLKINVAKLTFEAVGKGSSWLSLQSVGLWDTNLKQVSPKGSGRELVKVK